MAVFSLMNTGALLAARNLSVNLTNNVERNALDRIEQSIQQAATMPTLIDTAGNAASSPAAGVTFDAYLGGPYVITATGTSLPSTTSTLNLVRTTNAVAIAPIPKAGDVLQINLAPSTVRARISTVVTGTPDGAQHQTVTATLASALGAAVPIPTSGAMTASLVRKVAMIVMPAGGSYQLRYYPSYETTTNLNDPTQFVVLTKEIAAQTADTTPFSITQLQSANFVSLSLRVRSSAFDQRLSGLQADQFNTFSRVDSYIRPKINPQ